MTISTMASVDVQNMALGDVSRSHLNVTSNGLPIAVVSGPSIHEKYIEKSDDLSLNELRELDKDVRRRRDAQVLLGGKSVLETRTYLHKGFAVDVDLNVDLRGESTPEGTIRKMRNVLLSMKSVGSPTPKDTAMSLMAMAVMSEAKNQMNKEIQDEDFGIPRVPSSRGTPFSLIAGSDNTNVTSRMDSIAQAYTGNRRLSGILINAFA